MFYSSFLAVLPRRVLLYGVVSVTNKSDDSCDLFLIIFIKLAVRFSLHFGLGWGAAGWSREPANDDLRPRKYKLFELVST